MPTNHITPMRCKDCDHVFFESRLPGGACLADKPSGLGLLQKVLGRVTCPECGSKNVERDPSIRT